jgi:hypothetical protein
MKATPEQCKAIARITVDICIELKHPLPDLEEIVDLENDKDDITTGLLLFIRAGAKIPLLID